MLDRKQESGFVTSETVANFFTSFTDLSKISVDEFAKQHNLPDFTSAEVIQDIDDIDTVKTIAKEEALKRQETVFNL